MIPRGIANANPGNLRKSAIDWQGEVAGADALFETFDTPEHGIRAMAKCLLHYQRVEHLNTIRQLINRWAPPVENNTDAYVVDVSSRCGKDPDWHYGLFDVNNLAALVTAIIWHENGQQPYSTMTILNGVQAALA